VILLVVLAFIVCLAVVGSSDADDTSSATYNPKCAVAWKAVRFYRANNARHRKVLGVSGLPPVEQNASCKRLRERMEYWRNTAGLTGRLALEYRHYHYNWREWLPDKWARVGACETGFGRRPGNWRHNNSRYSGAFGFAHSSWSAFVPRADRKAGPYPSEAYLATPRQQYEVALAIWRAYGFSGWGCRGA
jgi:hypothetical protein